jgi:transcriptional repressor NF-X1
MKTNERHLIHELATFYGLETQAMDPEPHRNVVAYASYGLCKIPSVTLSETIRREKLKVPPPVTLI